MTLASGRAGGTPLLSGSVLICTYNRATLLADTLESLAAVRTHRAWEVVVVDNNSCDQTRAVVERYQARFPASIRYQFEQRQGKSYALNSGLELCSGDVILFTDDDVRVAAHWIDAACAPLERRSEIDYTGGPVRPRWEIPPPSWIDQTRGDLWGTLAILDYGPEPFVFEERLRIPLGVNMAVRRELFDRVGRFHPRLGRRAGSLLGQEQSEFFARTRAAGVRGLYVPAMELHHFVPAARLTKRYFRRWWFWKGVARARVDAMHHRTELGLDLTDVPHVAGVPRFVLGSLPRSAIRWIGSSLSGDARAAARHQMACTYALGYVHACWTRDALTPLGATDHADDHVRAEQEAASLSR